MTTEQQKTRVLLLIEDNPGDADIVSEFLSDVDREEFHIIHATRMEIALGLLQQNEVDVILLDLRLPDCDGVESIRRVRDVGAHVPIVVLTGSDDEDLALKCIDAGAQDYLTKNEVRRHNLRRAIGYAITRVRERQIRELQDSLDRYRALSTSNQSTSVTAALAGSGAVALRNTALFDQLVEGYSSILKAQTESRDLAPLVHRDDKELLITSLGDATGGPRDLLDVHVAAVDKAILDCSDAHANYIVYESRLFALEMMGLLVDYYRVGHRRRFLRGV